MKGLLTVLFAALCVLSFASCAKSHISNMGQEYNGVVLEDTMAYYLYNGKKYLKGRQASFCKVIPAYSLNPSESDTYCVVDGSDGMVVYRELKMMDGRYHQVGEWRPMPMAGARRVAVKSPIAQQYQVNRESAHATELTLASEAANIMMPSAVDLPLSLLFFLFGSSAQQSPGEYTTNTYDPLPQ